MPTLSLFFSWEILFCSVAEISRRITATIEVTTPASVKLIHDKARPSFNHTFTADEGFQRGNFTQLELVKHSNVPRGWKVVILCGNYGTSGPQAWNFRMKVIIVFIEVHFEICLPVWTTRSTNFHNLFPYSWSDLIYYYLDNKSFQNIAI